MSGQGIKNISVYLLRPSVVIVNNEMKTNEIENGILLRGKCVIPNIQMCCVY